MKPVLRLLHISDLHMSAVQQRSFAPKYRHQIRQLDLDPQTLENLEQGIMPHDELALDLLKSSVLKVARYTPQRVPTYVLATGDLSCWGDLPSLKAAIDWLRTLTDEAGLPKEHLLFIGGNHDVWPGQPQDQVFPFQVDQQQLRQHRKKVEATLGFKTSPRFNLIDPIFLNHQKHLRIHSVDTSTHDPLMNTFAMGHLGHWPDWRKKDAPHQLRLLEQELQDSKDFHILLSHHPIYSGRRNLVNSSFGFPISISELSNKREAARALKKAGIKVIISGHVHHVIPRLHELHMAPGNQPPLSEQQLQLAIGTSAQEYIGEADISQEAFYHSWQCIDFYLDGDLLKVGRQIYFHELNDEQFYPYSGKEEMAEFELIDSLLECRQ